MINPRLIASLIAGALALASAQAANITTLYNTGVDNAHNVLPDGTSPDPHYTLTNTSNAPTTATVGSLAGSWVGSNTTSQWIYPTGNDQSSGNFIYTTTFNLAGFDLSTVVIQGLWATDNAGINIVLNNVATGITNNNGFSSFTAFTLNSGFLQGLNTLSFIVRNDGGPTGLRVEMTGTGSPIAPNAAPENFSTLYGLLLAVAILGGAHFANRTRQVAA